MKSKRSVIQDHALAWYIEEYNLSPRLSAHPVYYFVDRYGKEHSESIDEILKDYKRFKSLKPGMFVGHKPN